MEDTYGQSVGKISHSGELLGVVDSLSHNMWEETQTQTDACLAFVNSGLEAKIIL